MRRWSPPRPATSAPMRPAPSRPPDTRSAPWRALDGKLTPALVESVLAGHNGTEHMVLPRMVYISDTTEIGTVYTRAELAALRQCCDVHGLLLYLDGARLGSALTSPDNDLTLPDLAALTHAFTIGGTKNGALFGEALVLTPSPCLTSAGT